MKECRYGLPCVHKAEIDIRELRLVVAQLVTECEDSIRADERKKFAEWLGDNFFTNAEYASRALAEYEQAKGEQA